ncbi:MAG: aminotransferase class III-fold pyridoxal phosphate-dependent enzyme [Acidimicrobiia bacterium]|nr:aminotransferase class III-fold pyridoxal phosphate-dependent enzyme [Acidimicrobiia bacterium]
MMGVNKADLRHMILHFTSGKAWAEGTVPMYVRGEGVHLWDDEGTKIFDGLAGLFVVQLGHGRSDLATAAAKQMELLAYTPTWAAVHPTSLECAKLISDLAPADMNSVFFVSSGSEAVESVIKFARQYHYTRGNPTKTGIISRNVSYHGTTMGALSLTGLESIRTPFYPLLPNTHKVPNTLEPGGGADAFEEAVLRLGPENIGLIAAEPVQNSGGALVPPDGYWQELRRICDQYDILLLADEVITGFGRLGDWFGSPLVGAEPDFITFAKGATSGYAPIGGVVIRDALVNDLLVEHDGSFTHGATWGGHPVVMATSIANITAMQSERVVENVAANEGYFKAKLKELSDTYDVVTDVRGMGYFYAIELGRSRERAEQLTADETALYVKERLPKYIKDAKLLIRADDRGNAKLMLSPPLICEPHDLDELMAGVDQVVGRFSEDLAS